MALDAATKERNIAKSLTAWIQAKLVTIESLIVHYEDEPDGARPDTWVDVDYLFSLRRDFGRQVGSATLGTRAHGILNMNLCLKRQSLTNIYALSALRDKVIPYFLPTQSIPLRDYDTVGTPEVGRILCMSWQQADVDDGRESGVIVRTLSVAITYTEAFTLA